MSWDIHGNPLRRGHCEVHPNVHEEFPCSTCLMDRKYRESPADKLAETEHYLGQAQEQIQKLMDDNVRLMAALGEIAANPNWDNCRNFAAGYWQRYNNIIRIADEAVKSVGNKGGGA